MTHQKKIIPFKATETVEAVTVQDTRYLLWIHVEFLPAHGNLFVSLGCFTVKQKQKYRDLIRVSYTVNKYLNVEHNNKLYL